MIDKDAEQKRLNRHKHQSSVASLKDYEDNNVLAYVFTDKVHQSVVRRQRNDQMVNMITNKF